VLTPETPQRFDMNSTTERILKNPFYVETPETPTQLGPKGLRYDFNDGARLWLPKGEWYVELSDSETGNIIFSTNTDGDWVLSAKKYFIPFKIRVWERLAEKPFFEHTMDLKDKEVLIKCPVGTLGDIIAWMTYIDRFQKKHQCKAEVCMQNKLAEIFEGQYPNLTFTHLPGEAKTKNPYASYYMGLFFNGDTTFQPIDFRQVGLHTTAGLILGVDTSEEAPKVKLGSERKIKERYVCIACKGSSQNKMWNNGYGWDEVVDYLKSIGYRVLCIDKERTTGQGFVWNKMPYGVEDFTGNLPLQERIELLEHADFFIGLASGLAWLAWCCHIPIIMISGFSLPYCEFYTPYRVFNAQGCNGCWNDVNVKFERTYFWCPRHAGTSRQFECTRLITGSQVIGYIKRLMKDHNLKEII